MKLTFGAALLVASATCANAASFSFSGMFAGDADTQRFNFTVAALTEVTVRSFAYGGGIQSDGTTVTSGGFDTALALFDATGSRMEQNDDAPPGDAIWDSTTGGAHDALIRRELDPGDYFVTLMQYNNFSAGPDFSDGFRETASDFTRKYGCDNNMFCDFTGANRTGNWAVDVQNVAAASMDGVTNVPEIDAGSGLGSLAALGTLLAFLRARRRTA